MKSKSKKAMLKRKNEFRFHKIFNINGKKLARHPAYIFLEKGNIYIYVSITHSKEIDNVVLIKLRKNPNPNDKKDAYYVAEIQMDTKDTFSANKTKWKIDELDENDIRELFNKKR